MDRILATDVINNESKKVLLKGWIQNKRDHNHFAFIDLRDSSGIVQLYINFDNSLLADTFKSDCSIESVISVEGTVVRRAEELINKKLDTGEFEVKVDTLTVLSKSDTIPFAVDTDGHEINEAIRLKYRYLDLRRKRMQDMLKFRNDFIFFTRSWYQNHGFIEVETPLLTVTSPEGSRDFLVPSRLHKGKFYVLPQAPQQFKQLLMVAGVGKYFQIAPCFRDEDPRSDRHAGAFYQIDTEIAFTNQEDFFQEMEPFFIEITEKLTNKKVKFKPFPRIPYDDAIDKYGSDKPDLRFGIEITDCKYLKENISLNAFDGMEAMKCLIVPNADRFDRKTISDLGASAINSGGKGLAYILRDENGEFKSPLKNYLNDNIYQYLMNELHLERNCIMFIVADSYKLTTKILGEIRLKIGDILNLRNKDEIAYAWIVDFPMYEWSDDLKKYDFMHNPFSMPQGGMEALQQRNPLDIYAYQYDIVANGLELSSGAIRNHESETLIKAFEIAGYKKEEVEEKFKGLLTAFRYGVPPHGGFAPGVDRTIMLLRDEPDIREIYAFPLSSDAKDLMMGAPSEVSKSQLDDVGLKINV